MKTKSEPCVYFINSLKCDSNRSGPHVRQLVADLLPSNQKSTNAHERIVTLIYVFWLIGLFICIAFILDILTATSQSCEGSKMAALILFLHPHFSNIQDTAVQSPLDSVSMQTNTVLHTKKSKWFPLVSVLCHCSIYFIYTGLWCSFATWCKSLRSTSTHFVDTYWSLIKGWR